ncbi:uncharacterized protein LOC110729811 isoform X1 [Chenopodium quinoa]|uniref:Uncharacterized protein n=1 Tax=Chenopodium quinoa TaxID=63459 RepID=A0A803MLS5_CHEQI|nr:uncharacterized protein LOC110729811 isoform X1 [Chenopodium quinoa]
MACVPCAIEMEPKTLSPVQINHVKEQAVAIQNLEPEIASEVFVQGLREGMEQITEGNNDIIGVDATSNVDECIKEEKNKIEKSHHCLCNTPLIQSPDEVRQKEPVTAPF